MRIKSDRTSFFLSGDAGNEAEKGLVASGEALESLVLTAKLRRPASPIDRDFLVRVAPSVAIITSGIGSDNFAPLDRVDDFEGTRATVFRTDIDGATTATWDGYSLVVRTFRSSTETPPGRGAGPSLGAQLSPHR